MYHFDTRDFVKQLTIMCWCTAGTWRQTWAIGCIHLQ